MTDTAGAHGQGPVTTSGPYDATEATSREAGGATDGPGLAGILPDDLPARAADLVDSVVNLVHDKAIRPVALAVRAVVFGTVVAALAILVAVLLAIGALRILDVYAFPGRVWLSYVVLGGLFTVAGLATWSRRTAHHPARSNG